MKLACTLTPVGAPVVLENLTALGGPVVGVPEGGIVPSPEEGLVGVPEGGGGGDGVFGEED